MSINVERIIKGDKRVKDEVLEGLVKSIPVSFDGKGDYNVEVVYNHGKIEIYPIDENSHKGIRLQNLDNEKVSSDNIGFSFKGKNFVLYYSSRDCCQ